MLLGSAGAAASGHEGAVYEPFPVSGVSPLSLSMSADGRFVTYTAAAAGQAYPRVFVYDRKAKRAELVSVSSSGVASGPGSSAGADEWDTGSISGDGRFVAFVSGAGNLVAGDRNNSQDVFLRDRVTRTTVRVNLDARGREMERTGRGGGNQEFSAAVSRDGTRVLFRTSYDLRLDGGTGPTWYLYNRLTRKTVAVDRAGKAGIGAEVSGGTAAMSRDGRYVVFTTPVRLLDTDTDDETDVYLRDTVTGTVRLVTERLTECTANELVVTEPGKRVAYSSATVDASGRWVAFRAVDPCTRLPRGAYQAVSTKVMVKDVATGLSEIVDRRDFVHSTLDGSAPNPGFQNPVIAGDGNSVLYITTQRRPADVPTSYNEPTVPYNVPTLWHAPLPVAGTGVATTTNPRPEREGTSVTTPQSMACAVPMAGCAATGHPEEDGLDALRHDIVAFTVSYAAGDVVFATDLPMVAEDTDDDVDVYSWHG